MPQRPHDPASAFAFDEQSSAPQRLPKKSGGSVGKIVLLVGGGLLTVLCLIPCGVVGFVFLQAIKPNPHVTRANFDRIERGMTLKEVEAILGGEKGSPCTIFDLDPSLAHEPAGVGPWLQWRGRNATIAVSVIGEGPEVRVRTTLMKGAGRP